MKYQELIDSCKKAIAEGRCLGCQGLEQPEYRGNPNCRYSKVPTANDSLKRIKENLGVQEKIEL